MKPGTHYDFYSRPRKQRGRAEVRSDTEKANINKLLLSCAAFFLIGAAVCALIIKLTA